MHSIVLAATYELKRNVRGNMVPLPLLDLKDEPYLTTLVKKLGAIDSLNEICIVTNDTIKDQLDDWAAGLTAHNVPIRVIGDGTTSKAEQLGAIGDLLFALDAIQTSDDVLVVGGDNWFSYDLREFTEISAKRSPSVVVSRLPTGVEHSRFGLAELDADGRIVRFLEKPRNTRLPFKASCVYYFSNQDLAYLREFKETESTRCTPGVFLQWLAERTPVYAVDMAATWYDISGTHESSLRGPNALEFRDRLRCEVDRHSSNWERRAAKQMQWVASPEDLVELLHDSDPDLRIMASRLLGCTSDLLSREGQEVVVRQLLRLLGDPACNLYDYGGSQSDEEEMTFVSSTAANALADLGYEDDVAGVLAKAKQQGIDVVER